MKKLLALVLALVMVLSLCVTSNAAFAGEEYDYDEAVEVMAAVGVFQGDENGKFNGKSELTREQAAKLIAYLDLGEKVAEALPAVKVFNDVEANRWSAKYVAYCADAGYLAGVGNGNFDPAGKLTGYAFGKMLLCVLGYDAAIENFTGANWSIAVAKLMQSNDIAKGVSGSASAALTREEAAQYCLNALKADMVAYENKGTQITINGAVIATGASKAEVIANSEDDDYRTTGKDKVQQLVEKLFSKLELNNDAEETDDFGRPAISWEYDKEDVGTYADAADYVLVAQKDTTMAELLEDNDLEKKVTSGFTGTDKVACGTVVELWVENKKAESVVTYKYVLVTVEDVEEIDEDDELYEDYGAAVEYELEYTIGGEELEGKFVDALSESKTGYQAIGSFEEDDVLAAVLDEDGKIIEIAEADSFDGKIGAKGTNYVKVDGTKYAVVAGITTNFDDTYTFYQDPNGVVIGSTVKEEAEETLEYVYVLKAQGDSDAEDLLTAESAVAKVKVMYVDGTQEVVDYALTKATKAIAGTTIEKGDYYFTFNGEKVEFVAADFGKTVKAGWYAYTENNDGEITLKTAEKDKVSAKKTVTAEEGKTALTTSGLRATTSTKVVVLNEDGLFKTYTGYKNFPEAGAKDALSNVEALVVYGSSTAYAKTVYVYSDDVTEAEEKIDVAMYVSTGDQTDEGFETTFVVDGEKETYVLEAKLSGAKAGQLYEITINDDDVTATALTAAAYKTGVIVAVDETYVAVEGVEKDIELADDCAVYSVAKDGKSVSEGTLDEKQNVVVFADEDGTYLIFIYKTALYETLYK